MKYIKFIKEKFYNNQTLILMTILILSFILRIYKLDTESLWLDEGISIESIAKNDIGILIQKVIADDNPPFYYIILHFWIQLFGNSEFSTRFLSVIFGVMSVYVIYRIGEYMFGKEIGLVSAFLLSISLFHIYFSQEVRFYSLLALLILLSNYFFVRMMKKNTKIIIIGYILSSVMMIYTHIFGLFYLAFQYIYYILIYRKNMKLWISIQIIILSSFIFWIPIILYQIKKAKEGGMINWISVPTYLTIFNSFRSFAGSDISLYIFIVLAIIGILEFILEFNKIDKIDNNVNNRIFLLSWLFIPIIISLVISWTVKPIFTSKYVIGSLPALIILVSIGVVRSINFFRKDLMVILMLIISVVIIIFLSYPLLHYYNVAEKEQWRDVANYIQNNKGDNEIILLYPGFLKYPFGYYYHDSNLVQIGGAYQVENSVKGKDGVWLIFSHNELNQSKLIEETLNKSYTKRYYIFFVGMKLTYYLSNKFNVDISRLNNTKTIYLKGDCKRISQPFISTVGKLDAVQLKVAELSDIIKVYIQTDNNGIPGDIIGNISVVKPHANTDFIVRVGRIRLESGNNYWITVERSGGDVALRGGNKSLYFKTLYINDNNTKIEKRKIQYESGNNNNESYKLTWEDDFEKFDTNIWTIIDKGLYRPYQIFTDNGSLYIRADIINRSLTSGHIVTKDKFKYGFFEVRAIAADTSGLINQIWLNNVPESWTNEIDIQEKPAKFPICTGTVMYKDSNNKSIWSSNIARGGYRCGYLNDTYHLYQLEWTDKYIRWLIDNEEIRKETRPEFIPHIEMQLKFALCGGNTRGVCYPISLNWDGNLDIKKLPDDLIIDYVRVYQRGR